MSFGHISSWSTFDGWTWILAPTCARWYFQSSLIHGKFVWVWSPTSVTKHFSDHFISSTQGTLSMSWVYYGSENFLNLRRIWTQNLPLAYLEHLSPNRHTFIVQNYLYWLVISSKTEEKARAVWLKSENRLGCDTLRITIFFRDENLSFLANFIVPRH